MVANLEDTLLGGIVPPIVLSGRKSKLAQQEHICFACSFATMGWDSHHHVNSAANSWFFLLEVSWVPISEH